ncbi:MAG: hypothetical protein RLY49_292 [Candidatus Parcubacteria bacterium]|jgi:hypothetical protein
MKKILEFLKWFVIIFISGPILFILVLTIFSPLNPWGTNYPNDLINLFFDTWGYVLNLIKHPFNWYVALVAVVCSGVFFRGKK